VSVAADSSKRQRLQHSSELPLDKDGVLDLVFVGGGEHLYVSAVSRRWKGRYLRHCVKNTTWKGNRKFVTCHSSVLMTESRLQLALSSGLTVKDWSFSSWPFSNSICKLSLEPEKVITLLRVLGVPWDPKLCEWAAHHGKRALLQWLHSQSCPWIEQRVLMCTCVHGSVVMLEWLMTVTAPWSFDIKNKMLYLAGYYSNLEVMQWLIEHGAGWPRSFCDLQLTCGCLWKASAVQWALAHGSGWLNWQCQDYAAKMYKDVRLQQRATELLDWAHANGCPCTCGQVQQYQQQQ
jgi:hypothetical protein